MRLSRFHLDSVKVAPCMTVSSWEATHQSASDTVYTTVDEILTST